jgi:hypothetical protein
MGDEKRKRIKPKNRPYKKQKFDDKSFLKRSGTNPLVEDAEDTFSDYLNETSGEKNEI